MSGITEKIFQAEEVKELDIEIGAADVILQPSEDETVKAVLVDGRADEFKAELVENRLEVSYEKRGDHYTINSKKEMDEIHIYIPEHFKAERTIMTIGAGTIRSELPSLVAEEMKLKVGAGKLKAESMTVNENMSVEVGAGKVKLKKMHVKNMSIECGVGECRYEGSLEHDATVGCGVGNVELELTAQESDYNYKVSCGLGKVKINDSRFGSFASDKSIQNVNAKGNIKLDCGLGKITVKTGE